MVESVRVVHFARVRAALLTVLIAALAPSIAEAKYWYLGIGGHGYEDYGERLWNALKKWPQWSGLGDLCSGDGDGEKSILKAPTSEVIKQTFNSMKKKMKPCDVFVFYYGGHGGSWVDDDDSYPTDETDPGNFAKNKEDEHICSKGSANRSEFMSDDELGDLFCCIPKCVSTVAIFDCCRAGGMVGGTKDLSRDECQKKAGLFVMMGCEEDKTVGTSPCLTEGLIEGLEKRWWSGRPKADSNGDNRVTASEWYTYAYNYMKKKHEEDPENPLPTFCNMMDKKHGEKMIFGTPEPTTCVLLVTSLPIGWMWLRRRSRS